MLPPGRVRKVRHWGTRVDKTSYRNSFQHKLAIRSYLLMTACVSCCGLGWPLFQFKDTALSFAAASLADGAGGKTGKLWPAGGALNRPACCMIKNISALIERDAMKWPSWSHRKHLHRCWGAHILEGGATYWFSALSAIAAADSFSSLWTTLKSSCNTGTKLSISGEG